MLYTEEAKVNFTYSDNSITGESYYVGYVDGVKDDEETTTYYMTLDSDGYITQGVYEHEGEGEVWSGNYDYEQGEYVYTVEPYTYVAKSTETFEYSNKYIKTYISKRESTDTYEDGSTEDYEYLDKEVYTHTSGNLTSYISYYYNESEYVEDGCKGVITYGSDLNNLSLDLAAFFQQTEASESLLLMQRGLDGKSSTNLPTTVDRSWSGDNGGKHKYEYNYTSGKLTSVDVSYGEYYGGTSDYGYDYTIEIEYY